MTLTLVASDDSPAFVIRDHVLPIVRAGGQVEVQRDSVRLITLQTGPWSLRHWTPFNELSGEEASSPGYRHALTQQRTKPDLSYGLDVWHCGSKVLSPDYSPRLADMAQTFDRS